MDLSHITKKLPLEHNDPDPACSQEVQIRLLTQQKTKLVTNQNPLSVKLLLILQKRDFNRPVRMR